MRAKNSPIPCGNDEPATLRKSAAEAAPSAQVVMRGALNQQRRRSCCRLHGLGLKKDKLRKRGNAARNRAFLHASGQREPRTAQQVGSGAAYEEERCRGRRRWSPSGMRNRRLHRPDAWLLR
jgi:hypothetical protein